MTFNLVQMIADRDAGTPGEWFYDDSRYYETVVTDVAGEEVRAMSEPGNAAVDARRMIGMRVHPARVLANAAVLVFEAFVLLAEPPLYGLWTGLITLVIILYNFAGVWAMARVLLPRLLGRRGKALVAAVDGWLKPKKA